MIRWGIIGCGRVTEVKSGPAFQKADGSALIAVMRRTASLAKDYAARHAVSKWYNNAEALIRDPEVDAVYIATPPASHLEYTLAAARAGKPVYVEKPMALNYRQCQEMIETCDRAQVPLFVAYYRRALPRFLKIQSLLHNHHIGDIRFITVTYYQKPFQQDVRGEKHWRIDPDIAGCGYFCDLGSHMIDILQFFYGEALSATGKCENQMKLYPAEDLVTAQLTFADDIHCVGVWNFNSYTALDRTEIIGAHGKITYATFGDSPIVVENEEGKQEFTIANPLHIQQPLIQTIVDELHGRGRCPSTGLTASMTNWLIDHILGK